MLRVTALLAAACVWLLVERNNFSDQTKDLEKKVATTQRQKEALDLRNKDLQAKVRQLEDDLNVALNAPPPAPPSEKKTWLQERIEERGSALESAPRRYEYYPNPRSYYPSPRSYSPDSRIIR